MHTIRESLLPPSSAALLPCARRDSSSQLCVQPCMPAPQNGPCFPFGSGLAIIRHPPPLPRVGGCQTRGAETERKKACQGMAPLLERARTLHASQQQFHQPPCSLSLQQCSPPGPPTPCATTQEGCCAPQVSQACGWLPGWHPASAATWRDGAWLWRAPGASRRRRRALRWAASGCGWDAARKRSVIHKVHRVSWLGSARPAGLFPLAAAVVQEANRFVATSYHGVGCRCCRP